MMDNRCPICGQYGQEIQEQKSRTETDQYHDVKKFALKQGVGFIAGQVADAFIPGSSTYVSMGVKALTGEYYDNNQPKSKTHYYTYTYYICNTCNQKWDKKSNGMAMINKYYAKKRRRYSGLGKLLFHIPLMPYYGLGIALAINVIVFFFVFLFFFGFGFFYWLFEDAHYYDQFFTATWWPTVNWIKSFVSLTWIYYVIYIPIILIVFFLKTFIHNSNVSNEANAKKRALAERLGIEIK